MLYKLQAILKIIRANSIMSPEQITVGELATISKLPKTTVRRLLKIAENSNLVDCELVPYKSTGKRLFWLTEDGNSWINSWRGLGI